MKARSWLDSFDPEALNPFALSLTALAWQLLATQHWPSLSGLLSISCYVWERWDSLVVFHSDASVTTHQPLCLSPIAWHFSHSADTYPERLTVVSAHIMYLHKRRLTPVLYSHSVVYTHVTNLLSLSLSLPHIITSTHLSMSDMDVVSVSFMCLFSRLYWAHSVEAEGGGKALLCIMQQYEGCGTHISHWH